jgi:hypothetical protein
MSIADRLSTRLRNDLRLYAVHSQSFKPNPDVFNAANRSARPSFDHLEYECIRHLWIAMHPSENEIWACFTAYEYIPLNHKIDSSTPSNSPPRLVYIDRLDSTRLGGIETHGLAQNLIVTFLEGHLHQGYPLEIHIYSKPSETYLLPNSQLLENKRTLSGEKLLAWWQKTLELVLPETFTLWCACPANPNQKMGSRWRSTFPYPQDASPKAVIPCLPDHELSRLVASDAAKDVTNIKDLLQLWEVLAASKELTGCIIARSSSSTRVRSEGQPVNSTVTEIQFVQLLNILMDGDFGSPSTMIRSVGTIIELFKTFHVPCLRVAPVGNSCVDSKFSEIPLASENGSEGRLEDCGTIFFSFLLKEQEVNVIQDSKFLLLPSQFSLQFSNAPLLQPPISQSLST